MSLINLHSIYLKIFPSLSKHPGDYSANRIKLFSAAGVGQKAEMWISG